MNHSLPEYTWNRNFQVTASQTPLVVRMDGMPTRCRPEAVDFVIVNPIDAATQKSNVHRRPKLAHQERFRKKVHAPNAPIESKQANFEGAAYSAEHVHQSPRRRKNRDGVTSMARHHSAESVVLRKQIIPVVRSKSNSSPFKVVRSTSSHMCPPTQPRVGCVDDTTGSTCTPTTRTSSTNSSSSPARTPKKKSSAASPLHRSPRNVVTMIHRDHVDNDTVFSEETAFTEIDFDKLRLETESSRVPQHYVRLSHVKPPNLSRTKSIESQDRKNNVRHARRRLSSADHVPSPRTSPRNKGQGQQTRRRMVSTDKTDFIEEFHAWSNHDSDDKKDLFPKVDNIDKKRVVRHPRRRASVDNISPFRSPRNKAKELQSRRRMSADNADIIQVFHKEENALPVVDDNARALPILGHRQAMMNEIMSKREHRTTQRPRSMLRQKQVMEELISTRRQPRNDRQSAKPPTPPRRRPKMVASPGRNKAMKQLAVVVPLDQVADLTRSANTGWGMGGDNTDPGIFNASFSAFEVQEPGIESDQDIMSFSDLAANGSSNQSFDFDTSFTGKSQRFDYLL